MVDHDPSRPERVVPELLQEQAPAFIRSDHAAEVGFPPSARMLLNTFAAPPSLKRFRIDMDHRNRRFRRDPAHTAPDIVIEDEVADDEDGGLRKPLKMYCRSAWRGRRAASP